MFKPRFLFDFIFHHSTLFAIRLLLCYGLSFVGFHTFVFSSEFRYLEVYASCLTDMCVLCMPILTMNVLQLHKTNEEQKSRIRKLERALKTSEV